MGSKIGASHRGVRDIGRIQRELAGGVYADSLDPTESGKWITREQAATILSVSAGSLKGARLGSHIRAVCEFRLVQLDAGHPPSYLYLRTDIERIGALKRHNAVGLVEACRLFCEEQE